MFVVAENKEEFRKLLREEIEAAQRKTLVTVQSSTSDPEAIVTYEQGGEIVGRSGETVRGWTVGKDARLRRYKMKGSRSVGVKRSELLALWSTETSPEPPASSPDDTARSILSKRRGKR